MLKIGNLLASKSETDKIWEAATTKEMTWGKACAAILNSEKTNGYAKAYAQAGLSLGSEEAKRVQALYILGNIQHWRGENSKEVRSFFHTVGKR